MLLLPCLKKHRHGTLATAVQPPAPAIHARRHGRRRRGRDLHDVHVRQPPAATARVRSAAGGLPAADALGQLPAASVPAGAGVQPNSVDAGVQPDAVGVVPDAEHAIVPHPAGDALPAVPWVPKRRGGLRPGVARGDLHGGRGGRSLGYVIVRRRVLWYTFGRELHRSIESHGNYVHGV